MIAELPPSPSMIGGYNFFKRVPVRRALLQELGPNDPKLNLKMAESLLTISAHRFMEKWNFDPITMKPKKGKYLWTPLRQTPTTKYDQDSEENDSKIRPISSRLNLPPEAQINSTSALTIENTPTDTSPTDRLINYKNLPIEENLENSTDRLHAINSSTKTVDLDGFESSKSNKKTYQKSTRRVLGLSIQSKPTFNKPRQCKITEYGRQRKRVNSSSKSEEDLEKSPRKKIILESPLKG